MSNVNQNLENVRESVKGYNPKIIAVTKYYAEDKLLEAYDAGVRDFAESKVQDALQKIENLPEKVRKSSTWHFIGHLQSNKVRKVVGTFDYIHSVDSLKLAKNIARVAEEYGIKQKILVQVNIADEESKFGLSLDDAKRVFKEILLLETLEVVGLMNIAPYTPDNGLLKAQFTAIKELRDSLQCEYDCSLPELSMGMSSDYQLAVESGATMIRLGQILFK